MALVGEQGRVGEEQLLVMEGERASITLQGKPGGNAPALSVLRRGAAPVHVRLAPPREDGRQWAAGDDDPVGRWDAAQRGTPGAAGGNQPKLPRRR